MRPVSHFMSMSILDLWTHHTSVIVHIRVERYSKRSWSTGAKSPAWYTCYGWGEEVVCIYQTARDGGQCFHSICQFISIQFTDLILFPNWTMLPSAHLIGQFNIAINTCIVMTGISRCFSLPGSYAILLCQCIYSVPGVLDFFFFFFFPARKLWWQ